MVEMISNLWFVLLAVIITVSNSAQGDDIRAGYISIDCGATDAYNDTVTGIWYEPDAKFVKTGINHVLTFENSYPAANYPYYGTQVNTLRSFPQGKRNCYNLKPKQGKNGNYLIRASFAYGNYDNKSQAPSFELDVGVYIWETISSSSYHWTEVIYAPLSDTIDVCLVNTGEGVPFISTLELRTLHDSIYQIASISIPLYLQYRYGIGISSQYNYMRYTDDAYDRLWSSKDNFGNTAIYINGSVDGDENDAYKLPAQVLSTAAQLQNGSSALQFGFSSDDYYQYFYYLHFLEFERLPKGQKRVINITVDNNYTLPGPITLEYMKALTITSNNSIGFANFSITAAAGSDLPPILNGLECYRAYPQTKYSPTDTEDADAILEIKQTYDISRIDWQGDPCVPSVFAWTGLSCSTDKSPRIITLNLSSSKLTGEIAHSFFNLTRLENLYLSNNELTGPLPEFLAEMPNLKILDLSGNKLTGSIPTALKEKSDNKTLLLSLDGNPDLCLRGWCKIRKLVITIVSCIAAGIVIITIAACYLMIWRHMALRAFAKAAMYKAPSYTWSYDVFINFRGEDTRRSFAGHLYNVLHEKGINAFMDDQGLSKGEEITPSLMTAIQESRTAIVIFSENYASSTYCLEELAEIMDHIKNKGRLVWPIFYHVDPSDVRKQKGKFGEALAKHETNIKVLERVETWRLALQEAANLRGWNLTHELEHELIQEIIQEVSREIYRNKNQNLNQEDDQEDEVSITPELKKVNSLRNKTQAYSKSEIFSITRNLKTKIGDGGFGNIYLGTLDGTQVAVELLSLKSQHDHKEFQSEVELLSSLHHRNLVSPIGYCNEGDVKALIYEYMDNGNLRQKLSEENPNVSWTERLGIAVDTAQGLDYLHNGCRPPIIFRNLTPANILLNANMQAKIADFSVARAFADEDDDTRLVTSRVGADTYGYRDPL